MWPCHIREGAQLMETLTANEIRTIIEGIRQTMEEKKGELIELDSAMGDGDLGLSMTAAFNTATKELSASDETDAGKVFARAGMAIAKGAPSTLGTLIATGFMRGGKALGQKTDVGLEELAQFFKSFVQGLMERGKAKPGEKTILDSLHPAARALESAAGQKLSLAEGVTLAYQAALDGLEETKKMKAEHGRAAYYGEKSIGKQDPGATVGMLLVKAFYDFVNEKS